MIIKKLTNDNWDLVNGTSYKGIITATRQELEEVFGKPDEFDEGDKVTTEWMFTIDGEVGTIYDWKRYEEGAPDFNEVYDWHIGGHNEEIVELVLGSSKWNSLV